MVTRASHQISRPLTEQQQRRYEEIRAQVDADRQKIEAELPELMRLARESRAEYELLLKPLRDELESRQRAQCPSALATGSANDATLTCTELADLEQRLLGNPSLGALMQVAERLGKRLQLGLQDR